MRLRTTAEESELDADRLWQAGAAAVAEVRVGAAGCCGVGGSGGLELEAGFPTDEAARLVAVRLQPVLGDRVVAVDLGDDTWLDVWKATAGPVTVPTGGGGRRGRGGGGGLVVAPAWGPVEVDGLVVRLDSGRAFGSGTHPTTRMLLGWLAEKGAELAGSAVLDVGTGSGVLAVAAAMLGASPVVGVDIDADAVDVARQNCAINGVEGRVSLEVVGAGRPAAYDRQYDVVLANLTAAALASEAERIVGCVAPGANLLVSGLLPGQWDHVAASFGGMAVTNELVLDGWEGRALERHGGRRPRRPPR